MVFIRESSSALFILRTGLLRDNEPVDDVLELFFSRGGGTSGRVESSAERNDPTNADLVTGAACAVTGDEGSGGGGGGARGEENDVDGALDARIPAGGGAVTDPDRDRGEVGWYDAGTAEDGGREAGAGMFAWLYVESTLGRRLCGEENDRRSGDSEVDSASGAGERGKEELPDCGVSMVVSGDDCAALDGGRAAAAGV